MNNKNVGNMWGKLFIFDCSKVLKNGYNQIPHQRKKQT